MKGQPGTASLQKPLFIQNPDLRSKTGSTQSIFPEQFRAGGTSQLSKELNESIEIKDDGLKVLEIG